jgi:hypothetical protein
MTMNEAAEAAQPRIPSLPNGAAFAFDAVTTDEQEPERNIVFGSLVTGDADIVGLVAYSIYKQNKHDWLVAFRRAKGREPQENEAAAYIVGESTPRRLATYRHLAEATLEGRGPTTPAGAVDEAPRSYPIAARRTPAAGGGATANWGLIGLLGLAIVALVATYLAARFGMIGPSK